MSNTTYTVFVDDAAVEGETRSKKAKAIELAELHTEGVVEVRTDAGTVVWPETTDEVETPAKVGGPWTRIESGVKFEAPEIEGYVLAYARNRVEAGVYRALDKSGWLVVQGDERWEVKNTTEAREITNDLAAKHREKIKAAKEAEAKAKAEAKAAKEKEKETAAA